MVLKRCSRCGEDKPVKEYYSTQRGLKAHCKRCHIEIVYAWQRGNAGKMKDIKKRYADKKRSMQ